MDIKVTEAVGSSERTVSVIDLGDALSNLSASAREQVKSDIGDYLMEQILLDASAAKSPITGNAFPKLSKEYKKHKESEGLPGKANLSFEGDMLDALTTKDPGGTKIEIGWWGDQAAKADGHNNLSGDSSLPERRIIPDVGQEFKSSIMKEVEKIISDSLIDSVEFKSSDFRDISTKDELYAALDDYFPDMSNSEIASAIARSPDLANFLEDLDLFDLL